VREHPSYPEWVDIKRAANIPKRQEHRRLWMSAFAPEDRERVDRLLKVFCDCFLIHEKHRYRLRPQDSLVEIYWHRNFGNVGDNCEFEMFVKLMKREFGIDFEQTRCLRDPHVTIGDVVRLIAKPVAA
jgi:hypothetical protein